MRSTKILLIRHGESTWNAEGRWQGQGDPPLSERGRAQAEALANEFATHGIEVLISSDLLRAQQTAQILAQNSGLDVVFEPRFREMAVGCWTGCSHDEIRTRFPEDFARFFDGDLDLRAGGGETFREMHQRVVTAFAEVQASYTHERIAIVTHRGVIRSLLPNALPGNAETLWMDREYAAALAPPVRNAGKTV